ncbi:MAG: hypothetical protein ABI468_03020 [Candidatus Nanopelagicales bacterium]
MADLDQASHRTPAKAAGIVVGIVLCVLFTWLLAVLGSVSVGSGVTIVVLVLFLGWTVFALLDAVDVEP